MRKLSWLVVGVVLTFSMVLFAGEIQWGVVDRPGRPIPQAECNDNTKVWLGRSCVGEAGFKAHQECIGIAWVYATRYQEIGHQGTFERMIRRYSSAVKPKSAHRRPWILHLNLKGDKPRGWPSKLSWKSHRSLWLDLLGHLDEWMVGNRPNPVPTANHFGGAMDTPGHRWTRITPAGNIKFQNRFYHSPF